MMELEIVVARHREDLGWLWGALEAHPGWTAHVYNDGPGVFMPEAVAARVRVLPGDGLPCEPTKYIRHVLDHHGRYAAGDAGAKVLFTQADPLYHNPTFLALLEDAAGWAPGYQNLSLHAHPPPWGCAAAILGGAAPGVEAFPRGGRCWADAGMGEDWQGAFYKDAWMRDLVARGGGVTVSHVLGACGVAAPAPGGPWPKAYSAIFATDAARLARIPRERWAALARFVERGDALTARLSVKERACLLEYLWAVLLA